MKRIAVLLLPFGWNAIVHARVSVLQHLIPVPLIHLGGEKHCQSEVSFLGTQHNVLMSPARAQIRTSRPETSALTTSHPASPKRKKLH